MARDRRAAWIAGLALGAVITMEFAPAMSLGFAGDDFELLALARIGGFRPDALFVPHRSLFVKPFMNAVWAAYTGLAGMRPALWYGLAMAVHLGNAILLGTLAARLSAAWCRERSRGGPHASQAAGAIDGLPAAPPSLALTTGFAAAGIWAVHDRLAEPLFSLSSLNHSLTFTLYLLALLACLRALRTGAMQDRLLLTLAALCALFSYEVAASLIPAAAALTLLDEHGTLRERTRLVGLPLGAASLVFAAVQVLARTGPDAVSYYRFSPAVAVRNASEIGLSFLHIRTSWIDPALMPALVLGVVFVVGIVLVRDRTARFGLLWSAASYLPIAAIPEFSDRYHYIAFAGLSLAAGRAVAHALASWRPWRLSPGGDRGALRWASHLVVAAGIVHVLWSIAGAREQAAYYLFKSKLPAQLLSEATTSLSSGDGDLVVLAWPDDPGFNARWLERFEAAGMTHRFSEASHPIFVRPEAVLGAVYPFDLVTIAADGTGEFFRVPLPADAAGRLMDGRALIVPLALSRADDVRGVFSARLAERLRAALLDHREIPVRLANEDPSVGSVRFAYFERTDRRGAFEQEYGRAEASTPPTARLSRRHGS